MAVKLGKSSKSVRLWVTGFPFQTSVRDDFYTEFYMPGSKVNGVVLNFNGYLFRKATSRTTFNSKVQVGSPTNIRGIRTDALFRGEEGTVIESTGGFRGDNIHYWAGCASLVRGTSVQHAQQGPVEPIPMRNEAVTKALLDIADAKAGIGETLATFRQTAKLLYGPTFSLVKSLKRVLAEDSWRGLLRDGAKSLARKGPITRSAEEYLKFVYGWKPLMQDIFGIIELAKENGEYPLLLSGRGTSKQSASIPDFLFSDFSGNSRTKFMNGRERVRVNCNLWAQIDPEWATLRMLNRLGLLNPASLAWELVSWSFVVDWVVPIGPFFQALTAPVGLSFVDGTTSVRTSAEADLENWLGTLNPADYNITQDSHATARWIYEGYNRSALSGWPMPGVYFNSDPLGLNKDGSDRAFKALALAIVTLK